MPVTEEVNNVLGGEFEVPMLEAPCKEPGQFCFGCFCPCCAAYRQREQLLEITGEDYHCCGGAFPFCGLNQPQEKVPCLCLESWCCTWLAISSNRYMVQTRFGKRNTPYDEFILWFTVVASWVVAITSCFIDLPEEIHYAKEVLISVVQGCMHAQNQHEIEKIKNAGYHKPAPAVLQAFPPQQQMMIQQGKPTTMQGGAAAVVGRPVQQSMNNNQEKHMSNFQQMQKQF